MLLNGTPAIAYTSPYNIQSQTETNEFVHILKAEARHGTKPYATKALGHEKHYVKAVGKSIITNHLLNQVQLRTSNHSNYMAKLLNTKPMVGCEKMQCNTEGLN